MRSSSSRRALSSNAAAQPVLFQLVDDVAAPAQVAQQDALVVADRLRTDVLIAGRLLQHRADVHPALVRKGAPADERLVRTQRQIGQFGDVVRHGGQAGQPLRPNRPMSQLGFQNGDDRRQVRVSAALSIAVHRPLHVRRPALHGRDRIGHRQLAIVVCVDAHGTVEPPPHLGHDLRQPGGHRPAVGVAQRQHVGARVLGRFERPQRVVRVGVVAVKHVLGIVDHFAPVLLQETHGVGDDLQVFFLADPQHAPHVQIPGLAENRDRRRLGLDQRPHIRVLLHRVLREARRAERAQPRMFQLQSPGPREELLVLRVRHRPAALDVVDAQFVELLGDQHLVLH